MPLIEGIGDEVTQFTITLFVILIVCFAWWTTNISERRYRTILIERTVRSHRTRPRLTNHTHSATLVEATSSTNTLSEATLPPENMETSSANKPPEADTNINTEGGDGLSTNIEQEQNAIVETMDTDNSCGLRQRRLAFYDHRQNTLTDDHQTSTSSTSGEREEVSRETSSTYNELPNHEQDVLMEHNYAERNHVEVLNQSENKTKTDLKEADSGIQSGIKIKLKYINDDLREVDGNLGEPLGDFKRRHFRSEISANKLVKLIFKGKVLQQDAQTLQNCGLFDNCVVHCLIHNKRNNSGDDFPGVENIDPMRQRQNVPRTNNNNNQGREFDLGNILFALISFILGSAWYFRYVYAHLYTVTATIALVAVTGIFTVVMIGMYFPDHERVPSQNDNARR